MRTKTRPGTTRRRLATATSLVVLASGCGAQPQHAREVATPGPETAFADAFDGDVAGDAQRLWVAVAGRDDHRSGPLRVRVFSRGAAGGWAEAPRPAGRADDGARIDLVLHDGAPCLARTRASGRASVECLRDERWQPLPPPGRRDEALNEVRDVDGTLYALLRDPRHHVVRTLGAGGWRALGQPLRSRAGIARFGGTVGGGVPDVTVEEVGAPPFSRVVYRFARGAWRRAAPPLRGHGLGSLTSGSVRSGNELWVPVSEAPNGRRWPFSVWAASDGRWRAVGGRALNRTDGSAQGDLSLAGDEVWAIWQEHTARDDGDFATAIYAQRVDAAEPPKLVWRGPSPGPGRTAVRRALGRTWAMYMGPSSGGGQSLKLVPLG